VEFVFPVDSASAVSKLVIETSDGRLIEGRVEEKEEAKS